MNIFLVVCSFLFNMIPFVVSWEVAVRHFNIHWWKLLARFWLIVFFFFCTWHNYICDLRGACPDILYHHLFHHNYPHRMYLLRLRSPPSIFTNCVLRTVSTFCLIYLWSICLNSRFTIMRYCSPYWWNVNCLTTMGCLWWNFPRNNVHPASISLNIYIILFIDCFIIFFELTCHSVRSLIQILVKICTRFYESTVFNIYVSPCTLT